MLKTFISESEINELDIVTEANESNVIIDDTIVITDPEDPTLPISILINGGNILRNTEIEGGYWFIRFNNNDYY